MFAAVSSLQPRNSVLLPIAKESLMKWEKECYQKKVTLNLLVILKQEFQENLKETPPGSCIFSNRLTFRTNSTSQTCNKLAGSHFDLYPS